MQRLEHKHPRPIRDLKEPHPGYADDWVEMDIAANSR